MHFALIEEIPTSKNKSIYRANSSTTFLILINSINVIFFAFGCTNAVLAIIQIAEKPFFLKNHSAIIFSYLVVMLYLRIAKSSVALVKEILKGLTPV